MAEPGTNKNPTSIPPPKLPPPKIQHVYVERGGLGAGTVKRA